MQSETQPGAQQTAKRSPQGSPQTGSQKSPQATTPATDSTQKASGWDILVETKAVHADVLALQPLTALMALLEEGSEEGGPLQEMKDFMETILLSQRQLHKSLEDLHNKVDALGASAARRRLLQQQGLPVSEETSD